MVVVFTWEFNELEKRFHVISEHFSLTSKYPTIFAEINCILWFYPSSTTFLKIPEKLAENLASVWFSHSYQYFVHRFSSAQKNTLQIVPFCPRSRDRSCSGTVNFQKQCFTLSSLLWQYSLVQWNWSSEVTERTWFTCISDIREPISLHQTVHRIFSQVETAKMINYLWGEGGGLQFQTFLHSVSSAGIVLLHPHHPINPNKVMLVGVWLQLRGAGWRNKI